jgi:hypothetical protein
MSMETARAAIPRLMHGHPPPPPGRRREARNITQDGAH